MVYLCIRDIRVYTQILDGEVFYYRDKPGLEADAIIHFKNGKWDAIEIKMGSKEIEDAAKNLLKLNERTPSFLMVLTAAEYAYRRSDGIYIVPIGCLGY